MTAERTSIRGVVETVFYSGPTFSAGRLRTADGALEWREVEPRLEDVFIHMLSVEEARR